MATMPPEHKTTASGVPYHHPVSYQFDGADTIAQSLHSLFGLLVTASGGKPLALADQRSCTDERRLSLLPRASCLLIAGFPMSFLSGLWWKLLSVQPARILTRLLFLERIGNRANTAGLYFPANFMFRPSVRAATRERS